MLYSLFEYNFLLTFQEIYTLYVVFYLKVDKTLK